MQRHDLIVRSLIFAVLAGIIATLLAAWFGIRPASSAELMAQRQFLTGPPQIEPRSWLESNPLAAGLIAAVVTFVASFALLASRGDRGH